MRRLAIGDKVVALHNPFVPEGTPGIIKQDDHSWVPYYVSFEGYGNFWLMESHVQAALTESSPQKPTKELKVGDKVRIKSREWYEASKNSNGYMLVPFVFAPDMVEFCGNTYEIIKIAPSAYNTPCYSLKGASGWSFSEDMFDLDEPPGESLFKRVRRVSKSLFGVTSGPAIKGNLPLIKTNKLLTNIKLD